MDKTQNISLGGLPFVIDDAAYELLRDYLNQVRFSLGNTEDVDEIMNDVEARMAELLKKEMLGREVVSQQDVEYLVQVMGSPEQYQTDEIFEQPDDNYKSNTRNASSTSYQSGPYKKRLYRDPDNKVIGGVCSGLAHYFGIDVVWVRLIFVLLPLMDVVFLGISTTMIIFLYIILWIVVPEADTTAEKLEMRGEPVTFDTIKNYVGSSNMSSNLNEAGSKARNAFNNSGTFFGNLIKFLGKLFLAFIGLILFIVALSLFIGFLSLMFGFGTAGYMMRDYLGYLSVNSLQTVLFYIFSSILVIMPVVGLILLAISLFSNRYKIPRTVSLSLLGLFIISFIGMVVISLNTLNHFKTEAEISRSVNIPAESDTLEIRRVKEITPDNLRIKDSPFFEKDNSLYTIIDDDLLVTKANTTIPKLALGYKAKGKNVNEAEENIKNINYDYSVNDSIIQLNAYLKINKGGKWRNQDVQPVFHLPEGKVLKVVGFDDVESYQNGHNNWFYNNDTEYYTFKGNELICLSCKKNDSWNDEELENGKLNVDGDDVHIKGEDGQIDITKDSIRIKSKDNSVNIKID